MGHGLLAALYAAVQALMEVVSRVYFRRVETVHHDRFPARGPVLVVANHPAAWTDVVVLDVALDRKLHFLAHEPLFRPWPRRLLLALFSALPVWHRHDEPNSVSHNRDTFDRCRDLFRGGEAIAVFPEGVSEDDRTLQPLKTGAARLFLEHITAGDEAPALVPVGIYYEDRTAFRTRVVVEVGPPIPVAADRAAWERDPDAEAHALTAEIRQALEIQLAAAASHVRAGEDRGAGRGAIVGGAAAALATAAAAVGTALHAIPAFAIERCASWIARLPQQLAFARMAVGLFVLPLWYAALFALAGSLGGGAWYAVPAAAPVLGALACREIDRRRARARAARAAPGGEVS
jgi:1-acyl-sn-glycerol-3-phosphate acyltransferase